MDPEAFDYYASDRSRFGEAFDGGHCGSAGGAACGDLIRVSIALEDGAIGAVSVDGTGCAAARAAAAAVGELLESATVLDAARISQDSVAAELGGLSPVGAHAADLAAEATHRALGAAVMALDPTCAGAADVQRALAPPPPDRDRVLVAMSGGVDSAVAASVEAADGAEVVAVTLELWSDPANDGERSCCSADAVKLARSVAHGMGLPHLTVDLREPFARGVVAPFLDGYAAGETPNPCIRCNGEVRIAPMVDLAVRLGCVGLATGHYARVATTAGGPLLAPAADPAKDQTYMLAGLSPEVVGRLRFPLGEMDKIEVRALARERGIGVADRRESQDLCFLSGVGKGAFLHRHGDISEREGEIVDLDGKRLGSHRGHHLFTVGQRRGIGVAAAEPQYVISTDAATNKVVIGPREALLTDRVSLTELSLHRSADAVDAAKLRYHAPLRACRLRPNGTGTTATIELAEPTARPAPGQTAVLYRGEQIIGKATIA